MMAEDAVMHLVEGMGEIEAAIGQGEAFTVAPPFFGKIQHWDARMLHRAQVDQMHRVELVRHAEQHACGPAPMSGLGQRRPRGIACGEREIVRVRVFGIHPGKHRTRKGQV